jgi:copper resistance protein B
MTARRVGRAWCAAALAALLLAPAALAQAQRPSGQDHSSHGSDHAAPPAAGQAPATSLPPVTDADRQAAFPDLHGQHTVHDSAVFTYVVFDQLEWRSGGGASGAAWNTKGWVGGDVNRFWFRTEGEAEDGRLEGAEAHGLYGRAVSRWWDVVMGVRQDARPGPARTWGAIGIQGLAPYWFEVEATAYVGASGRTQLRLGSEYELLVTNRLILRPRVEANIYGRSDPERGLGSGLGSIDAGLRMRYEIRRELAPYVGVSWDRRFFGTADLARAEGKATSGTRLTVGARVWF